MNIFSNRLKKSRSSLFFDLRVHEFESLFEYIETLVDLFIRDDDRWFDTDRLGTIESSSYEDSALK